ncbi:SET domain-containing protein-lysine N-methyltransferase [Novipirellula artificiosorum]|uniref:Post-SET domain-containing protein n=1 Tax=Novipirellula artificiosorum TaxID=2528016 RepID=A0A5C6CK73_9BACT|nr:SET domain-containing protein-lysine N-methyltransferase [Novipirellula artificiosorum]TWU23844.1 hypothetical protein Poly41_70950 [Novipirellula artificiosorum]
MYPERYRHNPLYPTDSDFKIIKRDQITGLGVITKRSFETGDVVAALAGEVTTELTQHSLEIEPGLHLLDMHFAGFFLHSCHPNVCLDMPNRLVYALRPIAPNDYLLMDYGQTESVLFKQLECQCGSDNCRGWITGHAEGPNVELVEYQAFLQKQNVLA